MQLAVRRFQGGSGERFVILVDEGGMPLYYPALYVTAVLRGGGRAVNSIINALDAIKALCAWLTYQGIDLESRFKRSELLRAHEVHSLRDFLQTPLKNMTSPGEKVVQVKGRPKTVSADTHYNRMTVVADYLGFLASVLLPTSATSAKVAAAMVSQVKANRPKISGCTEGGRDEKFLDDRVLDALEEMLRPGSLVNPAVDIGVQTRNALMFALLRLTGMRRGELLNLRIDDCDFAKCTIRIVRRADSPADSRTYQPVAKTRERTIPLLQELMDRIHDYVLKYRRKVPGAKRHSYLFVTHRTGRFVGQPLSNSAFGKFMGALAELAEQFDGVHAHALRHHWNYSFSESCDSKGLTPEREQKLRSYLMGWSETSGTAATYNKRHIRQEAGEAVIAMQKKRLRGSVDE
jgi:integrase